MKEVKVKKTKKIVAKTVKSFLSAEPNEYGSITWSACAKKGSYEAVDANVRITDCSDSIFLNFDIRTSEDYEKRMEKLKRMISVLQEMKEFMESKELVNMVKEHEKQKRED